MTSIGLLLGVSAAKLGTMDMSVTRLLSIHVPALLPPTSTELDVPHSVQVAAVVGIGLVYQGTGHRHNAEVLLAEIGQYEMWSVCVNVWVGDGGQSLALVEKQKSIDIFMLVFS